MADADYESLDIDDSFNFDDDLDMDFSSELNPPPIKDDRNVITKTTEKFAQSAMGEIVNPTNLSKMVVKSLPREMQEVHSLVDDGLATVRDVYDDTLESIKGPIKETKKSLRALKSSFGKVLPEKLDNWLDGILADEDDGRSIQETKEQQQENQIAQVLAENFKWQAEENQEEKIKEEFRAATDAELGRKQAETLGLINAGVRRFNDYNEQVGLGYQRKMLELNFRQLFAQQGIYEEIKFIRKDFLTELQSITKNTALPELVKQKKSEIMKDMSLRRFIDFSQKTFNSQISQYLPNLKDNFKKFFKDKVGSFNDALSIVQQMSDGVGMMNDDSFNIDEQEIIESDQHKLARKTAGTAGTLAGQTLMGKMGKLLGGWFNKSETFRNMTQKVGQFSDNKEFWINEMIKKGVSPEFMKENFPWLADTVDDFFRGINPGLKESKGTVGFYTTKNLNEIAEFDNRTKQSITEIIPGYLARILQSSEGIRTGVPQPLTIFSTSRGGFVTEKNLQSDIRAKIFSEYDVSAQKNNTQSQAEKLLGQKLEGEEYEIWHEIMLKRARNMEGSRIEDLMEEDAFKAAPKELQEKWRKAIKENFGYDEETKKTKDDEETNKKIRDSLDTSISLMRSLSTPIENINELFEEYGPESLTYLRELGVVKEGKSGKFEIDNDAFYKMQNQMDFEANKKEQEKIKTGQPTIVVGTVPQGASYVPAVKPKGFLNDRPASDSRLDRRDDLLSTLGDIRDIVLGFRDSLLSRYQDATHSKTTEANYESYYQQDQKHRETQTDRVVKAIEEQSNLFKLEIGNLGTSLDEVFGRSLNALGDSLRSSMEWIAAKAGNINVDDEVLAKWERFKENSKSKYEKATDWVGKRFKETGEKLERLPGFIKDKGSKLIKSGADVTSFMLRQAKKPIKAVADLFNGEIHEDVYIIRDGKLSLCMTYAKLVAGLYVSQTTGKAIEKFEQIRGPILEKYPDGKTVGVILTQEDLANGLYDIRGEKFSTSKFRGFARNFLKFGKEKVNAILNGFNPLTRLKQIAIFTKDMTKKVLGVFIDDIYVGGEATPRIYKRGILNGEYFDARGNVLSPRHFESLGGDVYVKEPGTNRLKEPPILTLAEASEKGLFDSKGRPFKSLMGKLKSLLKTPVKLAQGVLKRGKEMAKGLVNTVFSVGKFLKRGLTLDMYPKFIYELLAWKFGAPEHHQEALKGNSLFALPTKLFSRVKEFFKKDRLEQLSLKAKEKAERTKLKALQEARKLDAKARKEKARLERKYQGSGLKQRYTELKAKVSGDAMREYVKKAKDKQGVKQLASVLNWGKNQITMTPEERKQKVQEMKLALQERKEKAKQALLDKKQALKDAKLKAKENLLYRKEQLRRTREALSNRIGGWRDALKRKPKQIKEKVVKTTEKGKGLLSKALTGAVALIAATLTKIWSWARNGFGITKVLKGIWDVTKFMSKGVWKVVKGIGSLGGSILKLAGQAALGIGKGVMAVGRGVVGLAGRAALALPGIAATAGSALMTGATAVGSGVVAAGSFLLTNPIGWAVLGIAGGYALWKFFKKDFEHIDRYRILGYGIVPENDKDKGNRLLAFEKEVYSQVRWDSNGKPTVDEIDWQKWAGFFWHEDAGQPTEEAWKDHVSRFEAWYRNRFQPVFLKHCEVLRNIDKKIDLIEMDDKLDDALKPAFVRRAFFPHDIGGQGPYGYMASPFSDNRVLDASYREVENQKEIVEKEYASDEQKLKDQAEGKKSFLRKAFDFTPVGQVYSFFFDEKDKKEAQDKLAFETKEQQQEKFKDSVVEKLKDDGEYLIGSQSAVKQTNKDGEVLLSTLEETGYKIPESANEFEFINQYLLGMPENIKKIDYELMKETEFKVHEELVKQGKGYVYKGDVDEFIKDNITKFGWSSDVDGEMEAFTNWVNMRLIPYVCHKKQIAMATNGNVDYVRMDSTLEWEELYQIALKLTEVFVTIKGGSVTYYLRNPYRPFKNMDPPVTETVFNKWMESLKNRKGKNLAKTMTEEEKEVAKRQFREQAKKELDEDAVLRSNVIDGYYREREERLKDYRYGDLGNGQFTKDTQGMGNPNIAGGYPQAGGLPGGIPQYGGITVDPTGGNLSNGSTINVGSGTEGSAGTFAGTGDVRGITWTQQGEFATKMGQKALDHNWNLLKDLFAQAANVVGVDAGVLARMAYQESGFRPYIQAKEGSAKGLFQFTKAAQTDMAKRFNAVFGIPNFDINNVVHQVLSGALLLKDNLKRLEPILKPAGIPLDTTAAYSMHFMGPSGAAKFYKVLAANPNASIYDAISQRAVRDNKGLTALDGKNVDRGVKTVGQVYNTLRQKMERKESAPYAAEARALAKQAPAKVSDANYGQVTVNPAVTPSPNIPVGNASPAAPSYDVRTMDTPTSSVTSSNAPQSTTVSQPSPNPVSTPTPAQNASGSVSVGAPDVVSAFIKPVTTGAQKAITELNKEGSQPKVQAPPKADYATAQPAPSPNVPVASPKTNDKPINQDTPLKGGGLGSQMNDQANQVSAQQKQAAQPKAQAVAPEPPKSKPIDTKNLPLTHNNKVKSDVPRMLQQVNPQYEELGKKFSRPDNPAKLNGMDPIWMKMFYNSVGEYVATRGDKRVFPIYSGYRSTERQKQLYAQNLAAHPPKGDGKVARPGRSRHEFGVALDITNVGARVKGADFNGGLLSDWEKSGIAGKWGFWRRLRPGVTNTHEDWHVENKWFMPNGQPAAGQDKGDGNLYGETSPGPVDANYSAPQSTQAMVGADYSSPTVGSGVPSYQQGYGATMPVQAFPTSRQPISFGGENTMDNSFSGDMNGVVGLKKESPTSSPPTDAAAQVDAQMAQAQLQQDMATQSTAQQTSIQQAMSMPVPDTQAQQAQQAQQTSIMKVDRELVSTLESINQKQLDVLTSIDNKFDKLIESMDRLSTTPLKESAGTKSETIGSSRQPQQVNNETKAQTLAEEPKEVPKGPINTSRPKAKL